MTDKDTRQAFPSYPQACGSSLGMTLRDYFAAKAMAEFTWDGDEQESLDDAKRCYMAADAMMEARK